MFQTTSGLNITINNLSPDGQSKNTFNDIKK